MKSNQNHGPVLDVLDFKHISARISVARHTIPIGIVRYKSFSIYTKLSPKQQNTIK